MPITDGGLEYEIRDEYAGWLGGEIDGVYWTAKVTDEAGEYGIDDGRVIKLAGTFDKDNWNPTYAVFSYDRGWDTEPDEEYEELCWFIIEELDNAENLFD